MSARLRELYKVGILHLRNNSSLSVGSFSKGSIDAYTVQNFIMFTVDTHMDADITMGDLGSVEVHLGGCEFMSQRDAY